MLIANQREEKDSGMKVAVTDSGFADLQVERDVLAGLDVEFTAAQCPTEEELIDQLSEMDYLISQDAPSTARVIDKFDRCRVISRYGVGVDNIDLDAAAAAILGSFCYVISLKTRQHCYHTRVRR